MNFVFNRKIIYLVTVLASLSFFLHPLETKAAAPISGLLGHWTFDTTDMNGSTTFDVSGNGKNGTSTNFVTLAGKIRQARRFTGTADHMTFGYDLYSSANLAKGTIAVWLRSTTGDADSNSKYIINLEDVIYLRDPGTNGKFIECVAGATVQSTSTPYTRPHTEWNHITCTWDGAKTSIYINSKLEHVAGYTTAPDLDTPSKENLVGEGITNQGQSQDAHGLIDDLRIYNRVLTQTEISGIYNARGVSVVSAAPTKQLVAHWTFDNADVRHNIASSTIFDDSGFKNHLITSPQKATSTIGKIKQAITFDGSNGYASSTSVFTPRTNSLTVSAWVKPRSYSASGSSTIMVADDGNSVWGCRIDNASQKLSMFLKDNASLIIDAISTSTLQASKWYHVVCVWDVANERATTYINGLLENQITKTSIDSTTIAQYVNLVGVSAFRGVASSTQSDFFNGEIDDLRVYNYALSSAEIAQIYNASSISMSKSNILRGLIGYWTMDDNDFFGSTMFDRSGFNIHMSANGNYSTSTPGKKKQARNTGASKGDYFQSIVNDPYVNPELGKGSVFAWVRTTSSTSRQAIFSDEGWIILEMVTGTIYCGTTGSDSQRAFYDQLTITDGQWHMVGCTWLLNTFTRVYIDGKQKSSNSFSNPQLTSTGGRKATIGREIYQVTNGGHFDGDIDEVKLYNRVLSNSEAEQLYNAGRTLKIK